ncbi:hypothetical protein MUO79_12055 [Candidatus Bathyarchaeota archaeon]|nr:hypothetical protein [Candidatus Bathyarchaeota archaeon]
MMSAVFACANIKSARLNGNGNAPVINLNILNSVRTITTTIVIETPESAFGSLHYDALFALAVVLFGITFAFNYLAGLLEKRLRARYPDASVNITAVQYAYMQGNFIIYHL